MEGGTEALLGNLLAEVSAEVMAYIFPKFEPHTQGYIKNSAVSLSNFSLDRSNYKVVRHVQLPFYARGGWGGGCPTAYRNKTRL